MNLPKPTQNLSIFLVIIFVIILGVVSRTIQFNHIILDKYLGDALYAVLFYLIFKLLLPKKNTFHLSLYSLITVLAIEAFQLTGIPLELRQSGNQFAYYLSIALGTKFSYLDIVAYMVGIVSVACIDDVISGVKSKTSGKEKTS